MITKKNRLSIILSSIAFLLLIPFVAMQFTDEVKWSASDFIVMGILLLVTGLTTELVLRKVNKPEYRLVWIGAVLFMFLLIWAELAVGIFGTPFAGS